jgi:hypothetical protein
MMVWGFCPGDPGGLGVRSGDDMDVFRANMDRYSG